MNYSADTGEEGKKGKILNFRPGIEQIHQQPLVVHSKERGDKLLSWVMAWCLVYWTSSLWVPGSMPGRRFIPSLEG